MAMKDAILKKKIGEVIYELMVKTTTTNVMVDDTTTLAEKLTTMLADIKDSKDKLAVLLGDEAATSITGQIQTAVQDAVDALTNEDDASSLAGKIKTINVSLAAINDSSTGILATAKKYTDDQIGLSGTAYSTVKAYVDAVKSDINASIAGAFHFKGSVNYVSELPTEGVSTGDVYQVKYAGESGTVELNGEFAYNGTEFVELGSMIDLSAYYTAQQTIEAINTAKAAAIETAAADATSKADAAKTAAIEAAAADATSKADAAKTAAIQAAAADATSKADAAKAAAIEAAATDATAKANAAQAAAEQTAANALNEYKTANDAVVAQKARFIVSATQPEDLTEADVWAQIVE